MLVVTEPSSKPLPIHDAGSGFSLREHSNTRLTGATSLI
jgi:hypothetical protein